MLANSQTIETIQHRVVDAESFPIPVVRSRPRVHIERVRHQLAFFVVPGPPFSIGMAEKVDLGIVCEDDVMVAYYADPAV